MRIIDAAELEAALGFGPLIERLRGMFRAGCEAPVRHHHDISVPGPVPGGANATLLLMPAWQAGRHIGVKIVTVFPENGARSLPSVMGTYLLMDGTTGAPVALLDGPVLTVRRTAAASALAADYLARPDAGRLLMVGTGAMAPNLVRAHAAIRPIREVKVWGRDPGKARKLADMLGREGFAAAAAEDLEEAVRASDIVSCATLSREPLVRGEWLPEGCHLDLVGGFTPGMREADDEAVRRARVFVDTMDGATKEAGDIVQPLASGVLAREDIAGDLFHLSRGERAGRGDDREVTLFKSVGTALEDLAAAQLAAEAVGLA
jgi:alanine dehydrogenase